MNHQQYIEAVAAIAISNLSDEDRVGLPPFKLVYGIGRPDLRGVTHFGGWSNGRTENLVEVCAYGEHNPVQLAGTAIHELGHVLAGRFAGHGEGWLSACEKLGLRRVRAAGTFYQPANFTKHVRLQIASLDVPTDGTPSLNGHIVRLAFTAQARPAGYVAKPCGSTHGCKGGKSRGTGSGSRMLKAICLNDDCTARDEAKRYTIRLTRKWADAGMPACPCGTGLTIEEKGDKS